MIDTTSLRLGFCVMALTMLALFYLVTYRTTRSTYVAWWCAALAFLVSGSAMLLLAGDGPRPWQVLVGNVLFVSGAACVWSGARSLRSDPVERHPLGRWSVIVAPVVVGVLSVPNGLGGGSLIAVAAFYTATWVLLGLATASLWQQYRVSVVARDEPLAGSSYRLALASLALGCGLMTGYTFLRWAALLALGERSDVLAVYFGGATTILVSMVLLTTVSFSVSTLSNHQQAAAMQNQADDGALIGVLDREEFLRQAEQQLLAMRRTGAEGQLIFADLDDFEPGDDDRQHATREQALKAFAESCRSAVRSTDLVGRYGRGLFVMFLAGATEDRATQITDLIDAAMSRAAATQRIALPTASYGIAALEKSADFPRQLEYADEALHQAKVAGRNRSIHYLPTAG